MRENNKVFSIYYPLMLNYIKDNALQFYILLNKITLFFICLNWVFDFGSGVEGILYITMFSLVGIGFLVGAWAYEEVWLKLIFVVCGAYLIGMNLMPESSTKWIIGIACILAPMIIGRFLPEAKDEEMVVD